MKLEIKAYKYAFPDLFTEAYNRDMWQDPKQYDVMYGKSQREAVKELCNNDDIFSYWELKKSIKTRRFKEMDGYSQETAFAIQLLTKEEVHHLTHSLGVEIGDFAPKEFYRNYSLYYEVNELCEKLVRLELMSRHRKLDSYVYMVTEKGIEGVKTLLLVTRN